MGKLLIVLIVIVFGSCNESKQRSAESICLPQMAMDSTILQIVENYVSEYLGEANSPGIPVVLIDSDEIWLSHIVNKSEVFRMNQFLIAKMNSSYPIIIFFRQLTVSNKTPNLADSLSSQNYLFDDDDQIMINYHPVIWKIKNEFGKWVVYKQTSQVDFEEFYRHLYSRSLKVK